MSPSLSVALDPAAAAFEAARIAGEIVGDFESASGAAIVAAAAAGAAIEATRARMAAGIVQAPASDADTAAIVAAATATAAAATAASAAAASVAPAAGSPSSSLPEAATQSPPAADPAAGDPITTVRMQRERILRALADDIAASPAIAEVAVPGAPIAPTSPTSSATSASSPTTSATESARSADESDAVPDPVQLAAAAIQRLRNRASTDFEELRGHYHRHDILVLLAALVVIVVAGALHGRLVRPPLLSFPPPTDARASRNLLFEYPRGWLKPEPITTPPPRIIRDTSGRPPKGGDEYHVSMTWAIDPTARIEVLIQAKPTWTNIVTGLELDRRTRWGELYAIDSTTVEPVEDQDWLRTTYHYANATKGDAPRVDRAIEYATVDREQLYVVTLFGPPPLLRELDAILAPTLRIVSRPGTRLAQQLGNRTRTPAARNYPAAVNNALDSTVMVVVADLVDGRLIARGGGSGVIVGGDGSILTNYHVIRDKNGRLHDVFVIGRTDQLDHAPQLVCAGRPNRSKLQVELDLALIKCDTDLDGRVWAPANSQTVWPVLTEAKPSDIKIGQRIWVIGYPDTGGGGLTLSQGTIDGWTGREGREGRDFLKVDAAISLGNSGGPVIDEQGRLIGVASFLRTRISNAGTTTSQEKLVRPIAMASDLLAIATIGWTPREGHTNVEIEPTSVEPVVEGVRIETLVIDAANEAPIRDALVMVLKPDINQDELDVNRIDDQVVAWGRSNAQGEVKLNQPVPVGTYMVLARATGYEPLIGDGKDKLVIDEHTPPRYDPWSYIKLLAR